MSQGCRDCPRCTESGLQSLIMAIPRLVGMMFGGFLVRMVSRICPRCDHLLNTHRQVAGRFAD